ncbi:MAG: D-glycero-beta-D-manno-heptose 1-phosphate adenylyltransferase [Bdellovibrionales bacterium]|nr:D-glycero-beta-D-manno-heptose 1-phosphate adenylyltransferase [Bdellovibrionales bacterium]
MAVILDWNELAKNLSAKRANKKVVFTNGCFDLLHVGHVTYLNEAKAQGDILVVGLNTDASVKKLKGESRPVQCQEDRAMILSNLKSVDVVTLFDQDTPLELITAIQPDVLVKGGDWPIDKIVGSQVVLSRGGEVKSLSFVNGKSTTKILEKILHL